MGTAVTYTVADGLAIVGIDDGKANALSPEVVADLDRAFDQAVDEAGAVLLHGRSGVFSAGFDLKVMTAGVEPMRELVTAGAELLLKVFMCPVPVVVACTGHALAAGALVLLVADHRVGADVEARIGLNEVAIGMALPVFGVEFARYRLAPAEFEPAVARARIYDPAHAVDAGYLDTLAAAADVIDVATAEARRLAELPRGAFRVTKARARQATADAIRSTLAAEMETLASL